MGRVVLEFGDAYGRNFSVNALRIRKVRGRFSVADIMGRPGGGPQLGDTMSRMPVIPGIHLEIDSGKKVARFYDPLADDAGRVRTINEVIGETTMVGGTYGPEEEKVYDLDDDMLKTLLLEMIRRRDAGAVTVIEGTLPDKDKIDKMVGHELFDPWNTSANKPKYKKDAYGTATEAVPQA